jgi:hypothetical protein
MVVKYWKVPLVLIYLRVIFDCNLSFQLANRQSLTSFIFKK